MSMDKKMSEKKSKKDTSKYKHKLHIHYQDAGLFKISHIFSIALISSHHLFNRDFKRNQLL
jgi:hypothetical protein